jgi:hypothetical protein
VNPDGQSSHRLVAGLKFDPLGQGMHLLPSHKGLSLGQFTHDFWLGSKYAFYLQLSHFRVSVLQYLGK